MWVSWEKTQYTGLQWGFFFRRGNFDNGIICSPAALWTNPIKAAALCMAVPGCWALAASLVLAVRTSVLEVACCGLPIYALFPAVGPAPSNTGPKRAPLCLHHLLSNDHCTNWLCFKSEHGTSKYFSHCQYCIQLFITAICTLTLIPSTRLVQP